MVDVIKMSEIESVVEIEPEIENVSTLSKLWNLAKRNHISKRKDNDVFSEKMNLFRNSFKIETSDDGYNHGRTYYLQCETKRSCSETAQFLRKLVRKARFKSGDTACIPLSRIWVRSCIHSEAFKAISALAIVAVSSPTNSPSPTKRSRSIVAPFLRACRRARESNFPRAARRTSSQSSPSRRAGRTRTKPSTCSTSASPPSSPRSSASTRTPTGSPTSSTAGGGRARPRPPRARLIAIVSRVAPASLSHGRCDERPDASYQPVS